jgi:putative ubiquitin-RnfH superfamily antitoxin RatB of RatAB toxin-antitoxin module
MASLRVEVVYALPGRADAVVVELPLGATAADAVRASGVLERHPQIDAKGLQLGIHGRPVTGSIRLSDGDRVEIYRPLVVDAWEARRRRAQRRRTPGSA